MPFATLRVWRGAPKRAAGDTVEFDDAARELIAEARRSGGLRIIANKRRAGDEQEYRLKEQEQRAVNPCRTVLRSCSWSVTVQDASKFASVPTVRGTR